MMLTLYGLPINFNYKDIKTLIRTQCKINDFILDNLTSESNGSKMIRVGLADESEGNHLIKCLNGFHVQGSVLKVMTVGKAPNIPKVLPVESYQRNMMHSQQSYSTPVPQHQGWTGQEAQWSASAMEPHMYQQPQSQVYLQSQPMQQTVPVVSRPLIGRYPTSQSYDKLTSMKESFQEPSQYSIPQPTQPGYYQRTEVAPAWTPHAQQRPQPFNQDADSRGRQDMRVNSDREDFKGSKAPGRVSPTRIPPQFEAPSRKAHRDISDGRMSPEKRLPGRKSSPGKRISPGRRISPGQRVSPGRRSPGRRASPSGRMPSQDHGRNVPSDRRQEAHDRERRAVGRQSPGRHTLGRHVSPSRRVPMSGLSPSVRTSPPRQALLRGRPVSPKRRLTRTIPPWPPQPGREQCYAPTSPSYSPILSPTQVEHGVRNSSPSRQIVQGGRRLSPPTRQVAPSGRRLSPPPRQVAPSGRRLSPPPRQVPPSGRRMSPSGRQLPQLDRHVSPIRQAVQGGRQLSPPLRQGLQGGRYMSQNISQVPQSGRHMSPPGRQVPQSGRHMSPPGRQVLQGGRHLSPPGHQILQGGRQLSPPGRQVLQGGRHISPGRQVLQGGRHLSPPGRQVLQGGRQLSPQSRQVVQGGKRLEPSGRPVLLGDGRRPGQISERGTLTGQTPPGRRLPNKPALLTGRPLSPTRPVLLGHMPPDQMPERHTLPMRHVSPSKRQISPNARSISPNRRRISPNGRRISPNGRRISPNGRRISPNVRRISPIGRRISPSGHRNSASDRRISPSGRRVSPHRRLDHDAISSERNMRGRPIPQEMSMESRPSRQLSPHARQPRSPVRMAQRRPTRYSPPHGRETIGKYEPSDERADFKNVRPAFDKAQNETYVPSSAYRPNIDEDKSYERKNPGRVSRWQEVEKQFPPREITDRNRDLSGPYKPELGRFSEQKRLIEEQKKSRSLTRESPRDRSPIRDRIKRHSPSPRSPRRSWALEKRRSPEINKAPPPPIWPGQDEAKFQPPSIPQYSGKNQEDPCVSWQRKFEDQRHQINAMEEKRDIGSRTWKPHIGDRAPPQRFGEGDRFTEHPDKFERREDRRDDTYQRVIKEPSREGTTRQDYEGRSNPMYIKDEHSRQQSHKEYDSFQKRGEIYKEVENVYERSDNFPIKSRNEHQRDMRRDEYQSKNAADHKEQDRKFKEVHTQRRLNEKGDDYSGMLPYLNELKEKREKAALEISRKLMASYGGKYAGVTRVRIREALKKEIGFMMFQMFGNEDISFIESVVKFNSKHKDELMIFKRVATRILSQYKSLNRQNLDVNEIPAKRSRAMDISKLKKGPPLAQRARVIPRAGLKRPNEPRQPQPSKVTKRDQSHRTVIEGKAVSYLPKTDPKRAQSVLASKKAKQKPNFNTVKTRPQTGMEPKAQVKPQAKAAVEEKSADKLIQTNTKPTPKKPQASPAAKQNPVQEISKPKVETATAPDSQSQGGVKVLTVAQINRTESKPVEQNIKIEEKKVETEEKSAKEEKSSETALQLSEVESRALKKELRDIMAEVWRSLLDTPDADDACALEIIRHEVGEQIRSALGLNVAKGLLNVFNPLMVKIQFSRRPESGCLPAFLSRHRVRSFRRLPDAPNTFAATVADRRDFDALCAGDAKCGSADLKITPCYKFTQCPAKLKINLDDDEDDIVGDEEDDIIGDEENDIIGDDDYEEAITTEEPEDIDINKPSDNNEIKNKEVIKMDSKETKQEGAKATVIEKVSPKSTEKINNMKIQSKENKETKQEVKPTVNENAPPKATEKTNNTGTDKGKTNVQPKENVKAADVPSKETPKTDIKSNEVRKDVKPTNVTKETNKKETKVPPRKINAKGRYVDRKNIRNSSKPRRRGSFEVIDETFDDDDELDDADILAMLSGGVVLDECGSDD